MQASRQSNAPVRAWLVPAQSVFVPVSARVATKRKSVKPTGSVHVAVQPVSARASSRTSVSV